MQRMRPSELHYCYCKCQIAYEQNTKRVATIQYDTIQTHKLVFFFFLFLFSFSRILQPIN